MSRKEQDVIQSILEYSFGFFTIFGLSTHRYDRDLGRLVSSTGALGYSLVLHLSQALLLPSVYRFCKTQGFRDKSKREYLNHMLMAIVIANFVSIAVSITRQWLTRARQSTLFNEVIFLWLKDMSGLRSSAAIRRAAGRVFISVTVVSVLHVAGGTVSTFCNTESSLMSLVCAACFCSLISVITVVECQFSQGMMFASYLFEVLNHNLEKAVAGINGCCDSRRESRRLSRELLKIAGLHSRLRRWTIRFKDMYQVELVFNMTTYFVTQVLIFFISTVLLRKNDIMYNISEFLPVVVTTVVGIVDMWNIFYTCDRVIESCNAAGVILRDLGAPGVTSRSLQRVIEVTCFQVNREQLRLRICGLTDIAWRSGFVVTETALMHIILLIQLDYKNY